MVVNMVFAPAMAIACLQFLSFACWFVAALGVIGAIRHTVAPTGEISVATMGAIAAGFSIAALACRWAVGKVRQAAGAKD
jgi:hypothetical protein